MGYYTPDPYNQPEQFGLKVIGAVEWSEPCYSFDTTVVWEGLDQDGVVYYMASDSGCSCPSPFENLTSLDKMDFTTRNVREMITKLEEMQAEQSDDYSAGEVVDLISKLLRR